MKLKTRIKAFSLGAFIAGCLMMTPNTILVYLGFTFFVGLGMFIQEIFPETKDSK